jgi:hypothetical protein
MRPSAFLCLVFTLLLFSVLFSCNKDGAFLGETNFSKKIILSAFVTDSAYFKVTIDDTTIQQVPAMVNSFGQILDYTVRGEQIQKNHLKIRWKNHIVIDTFLSLGSVNQYYLIQFDRKKPPVFFFNFGEPTAGQPMPDNVKVRLYYARSAEDPTPLPDTIKVQFFRIVGTQEIQDTSITLGDGAVSPYIELPDSEVQVLGLTRKTGYQIVDPETGTVLQRFCLDFQYGVQEFSSKNHGKFITTAFEYVDQVSGCNFGSPEELHKLKVLFAAD